MKSERALLGRGIYYISGGSINFFNFVITDWRTYQFKMQFSYNNLDLKMIKYLMVCFLCMVFILQSLSPSEARQGVDVSELASTEIFSCLKQKDYDFAIVRAYRSIGQPDMNAPATIQNARAANVDVVGVYMFPCPKCDISAQTQVCLFYPRNPLLSPLLTFLASSPAAFLHCA